MPTIPRRSPSPELNRHPTSEVREALEVVVRLKLDPVALGELMVRVTDDSPGIQACCFYHEREGTVVLLVTEDSRATAQMLETAGFAGHLEPVLLVTIRDQPTLTVQLGRSLTNAGIGLLYSYTYQLDDGRRNVVFKTTDDRGAARLLQIRLKSPEFGPALEAWPVTATAA